MAKKKPLPKDTNLLAKAIVDQATDQKTKIKLTDNGKESSNKKSKY